MPDVKILIADAVRYHQAGHLNEAIARYRQVLVLDPENAGVHNNLGTAFCDQGMLDEAQACYHQALILGPHDAEAHNNLGTLLYQQGKLHEAVSSYRKAIVLKPDHVEAHDNLGTALASLGKPDEALACYRRALAYRPSNVAVRVHLGTLLWEQGRLEEAAAAFRRALEFHPNDTGALDHLAAVTMLQGDAAMAMDIIWRSLQIAETQNSKSVFVDIAKNSRWTRSDPKIRATLTRALVEPWARPGELAHAAIALLKATPGIADCVTRAVQAWPQYLSAKDLYGSGALCADELLCEFLNSTQNIDIGFERFLTMARRLLLDHAASVVEDTPGEDLAFYNALARQCFINEYVFFHTADEIREAQGLRDRLTKALEMSMPVPALWVIAVAAYFPLHTLSFSARLLEMPWGAPLAALVAQQVTEPGLIRQLCDTMPKWTPVEDPVSRMVQDQYEENPYPRWVRTALVQNPVTFGEYFNRKFPLAPFRRGAGPDRVEMLCAGCGTGLNAIEFAMAVKHMHVVAVDLSLLSLGHAKFRTGELGVTSVDYVQADILRLGAAAGGFDLIECSGVLHHMADAFAGWRSLLSLLKPDGFMLVGLYSEIARRGVVRARQLIAERGFGAGADDIRRCRQVLLDFNAQENLGLATTNADFFGISSCRDLLFHSHEQQMTLGRIAAFLRDNDLTFLGFEIEDRVLYAYRKRFPNDPAAVDLDNWQIFERDNPATFSSMYMLWVQKRA